MLKKTLGIVVSSLPRLKNTTSVAVLVRVARERLIGISLYLIDDAVQHINHPILKEFLSPNVKLFVCAYGCMQRQIATSSTDKDITFCGLVILSNIVRGTDRFLSFN